MWINLNVRKMAHGNSIGHCRLLAVDDNHDCSELIVRTALKCGYEAFPVADAHSLRQAISHWRPHVITLDLCLPDVDGFEVIASLKMAEFSGQLIIISGQPEWLRDQAAKLASGNGLRVLAHMSKPVQLGPLRELLTTIKASLFLSMPEQFGSAADGKMANETTPDPNDSH